MLDFDRLDRAARIAAGTVPNLADDVYQDAWEKFLRHHPRTYQGARLMAFSARNDLLRRERLWRSLPKRILQSEYKLPYKRAYTEAQRAKKRAEHREYNHRRNRDPAYREYRRLYMQEYRRKSKLKDQAGPNTGDASSNGNP